jgi:glycosyltransferase involved in cell wall biosynthesis
MSDNPCRISIIVPVYNGARELRECLSAVIAESYSGSEIIVVDDASTDCSPDVAAEMGVPVLRLAANAGPSVARNYGVSHARGDIIFFVDADVVVMPGAVSHVLKVFEEHSDIDAVFGSYDAQPRAKGLVSQYRNLLHHFVHQNGNTEASTFWAGCGAVRRAAFEEVGGFDGNHYRRAIEDIELGYRLRRAGHRILLDKVLHGTHLKRWTLRSMIRTDIFYRAVPWTRLILESKNAPKDLNLKWGQRLSVVLVGLGCLFLFLAPLRFEMLEWSAVAFAGVIVMNRDLYTFFIRRCGFLSGAACIPLHFLYYMYSALTFLFVWLSFQFRSLPASQPKAQR